MALISRKLIDETDMVARYLANQLSDVERESFEAYYLEHPELLKDLNRTAQFKSGLMDLHRLGLLNGLLKPKAWWQRPGIGIAASVLLAVIVGGAWLGLQGAQRPLLAASITDLSRPFERTLPIANAISIQRTRTSSYDATIEVPHASSAVELRIKPETIADPARYRIGFRTFSTDEANKDLVTVHDAVPASDGFVVLYLNAAQLTPAVYELRISSEVPTTGSVSSFLVEVVAPASN